MRVLIIITFFFSALLSSAQGNRLALVNPVNKMVDVKVVVLDEENSMEPLAFASVIIEQKGKENTTNLKGEFKTRLASGNYTFKIQFVGYETKKLSNVKVLPGQPMEIQTSLQTLQLTPDVNFEALLSEKTED